MNCPKLFLIYPTVDMQSWKFLEDCVKKLLRYIWQTLCFPYVKQGFSQDFRIWYKNTNLGWIGCPIPFHPIALYTKNMDIRVSKISIRVSKWHPDTPLAKALMWTGLVRSNRKLLTLFTAYSDPIQSIAYGYDFLGDFTLPVFLLGDTFFIKVSLYYKNVRNMILHCKL